MEDLVPIVLFLTAGGVFCAFFFFRFRNRQELQQTLRIALEQGRELTPELLSTLISETGSGGIGDLRKGVLWIAVAAGIGILSWVAEEPDVLAVSGFPLMIGIAYLGLWRFSPARKD